MGNQGALAMMDQITTAIGEVIIHTLVALALGVEAALRIVMRRPAPRPPDGWHIGASGARASTC
jgi:hypothetical protein